MKRSAEIEVADVKGDEFDALSREDAFDHELDKFEWGGFGADVSQVADAVDSNGDASAVGIGFFVADFADNPSVSYFFAMVGGDGVVVDNKEGVSAVDTFAGALQVGCYALAETTKFV